MTTLIIGAPGWPTSLSGSEPCEKTKKGRIGRVTLGYNKAMHKNRNRFFTIILEISRNALLPSSSL